MPSGLDPYAKPPSAIREVFKTFQRLDISALKEEPRLNDPAVCDEHQDSEPSKALREAWLDFAGEDNKALDTSVVFGEKAVTIDIDSIPGLVIYRSLFPPSVQLRLLDKLLHRDLCNPVHQTNVHLHYDVPYPEEGSVSYFDHASSDLDFQPKAPDVHKPITLRQFLDKKLRWMTLGGQYNWTSKSYPTDVPPPFPADIKRLIEQTFSMKAEAAIVNLYSPNDTLSLHRDVSEACEQPLVSSSLGCDAIFVVGLEDDEGEVKVHTIRLRSGDALLMSGRGRYAWHGVPKVLADTCPEWMKSWPCSVGTEGTDRFEEWRGWMSRKRVNLNVRQMFDSE